MEISKVIIPAAGISNKFLPFSNAIPREMLPLLNKPAIQYVAEEALRSEIPNMFIITSRGKDIIVDHFDSLDNKEQDLANSEKLARHANFTYIRQQEQLGVGHAILMAKHSISKEYFGIALPDDIIFNKQQPALAQLIRIARQEKASVIAVQEVPSECISSYGIVSIKKQITPNLFQLSGAVEKPQPKDAPSSLAIVGRYVLSYKIFASLEEISTYATDQINLTDAISHMMQQNERVFAYKVQGTRYDLGTPLGWIKAVVGSTLQDPHYGPYLKRFISEMNTTDSYLYNPAKTLEHNL